MGQWRSSAVSGNIGVWSTEQHYLMFCLIMKNIAKEQRGCDPYLAREGVKKTDKKQLR
jgi:hypothetical protein